ncbi:MAG: hypothetical protein BJ554DRAFT_4102, partial [Olpidium bornovanus]
GRGRARPGSLCHVPDRLDRELPLSQRLLQIVDGDGAVSAAGEQTVAAASSSAVTPPRCRLWTSLPRDSSMSRVRRVHTLVRSRAAGSEPSSRPPTTSGNVQVPRAAVAAEGKGIRRWAAG